MTREQTMYFNALRSVSMTAFSERNFGRWQSKTVAPAIRDRARKVYALYAKGATEGERAAARNRLTAIADKAGITFDSLEKACAQ